MLGTYQPQSFWKCWASAKLTCKLVQVPAGPVGQFHSHHSDSIPQIGQIPIATNSVSCSYHPTLMIELDTPYWSSPKEPWSASPRPVPCRGNAAETAPLAAFGAHAGIAVHGPHPTGKETTQERSSIRRPVVHPVFGHHARRSTSPGARLAAGRSA